MPKRLIALILVCCCVFHQAVYAEEITLRLYRLEENAAYRRSNPHVHFQSVEYPAWSDPAALLDTGAADVVYLNGQRSDMRLLLARPHLLQDLSGSMMITDTIARMVPWVQDYITSADGSVYAVPLNAPFAASHAGMRGGQQQAILTKIFLKAMKNCSLFLIPGVTGWKKTLISLPVWPI